MLKNEYEKINNQWRKIEGIRNIIINDIETIKTLDKSIGYSDNLCGKLLFSLGTIEKNCIQIGVIDRDTKEKTVAKGYHSKGYFTIYYKGEKCKVLSSDINHSAIPSSW